MALGLSCFALETYIFVTKSLLYKLRVAEFERCRHSSGRKGLMEDGREM